MSLYPRNLFSRRLSATAHAQARPASPHHSDEGSSDFSSIPSLSIDLISCPVVYDKKCSNSLSSRASAFPEIPWQRQGSLVNRPRSRMHCRALLITLSIRSFRLGKYFWID